MTLFPGACHDPNEHAPKTDSKGMIDRTLGEGIAVLAGTCRRLQGYPDPTWQRSVQQPSVLQLLPVLHCGCKNSSTKPLHIKACDAGP